MFAIKQKINITNYYGARCPLYTDTVASKALTVSCMLRYEIAGIQNHDFFSGPGRLHCAEGRGDKLKLQS